MGNIHLAFSKPSGENRVVNVTYWIPLKTAPVCLASPTQSSPPQHMPSSCVLIVSCLPNWTTLHPSRERTGFYTSPGFPEGFGRVMPTRHPRRTEILCTYTASTPHIRWRDLSCKLFTSVYLLNIEDKPSLQKNSKWCVSIPLPLSIPLSWVWAGFSILLLRDNLQKDKDRNLAMGKPGNHHLNLVRKVHIISNVLWISDTPQMSGERHFPMPILHPNP